MRVALTFDDGPSNLTHLFLDLLRDHDAHATFFVIGQHIPARGLLVKRMADEGHQVGNHTYTHPLLDTQTEEKVWAELGLTNELIRRHAGDAPAVWRAPHLAPTRESEKIAKELGLTHVHCTCNPDDWKSATVGIVRTVTANLNDGAILDLHDGLPPGGGTGLPHRWNTYNALRAILEEASAEFVTVSELAKVAA